MRNKGGYLVEYASRSVRAHWDEGWFDIGGVEFPFVWSLKDSALHRSFPQELIAESEDAELTVWHYLSASRTPIPENMAHFDPFQLSAAELVVEAFRADLVRFGKLYSSIWRMWTLAPGAVLHEFGDLSTLPPGPRNSLALQTVHLDTWWPTVLFHLALWQDLLVLHVDAAVCNRAPSTWSIQLQPSSVLGATTHALRTFRRVAEDPMTVPRRALTTDTAQSGAGADADEPAGGDKGTHQDVDDEGRQVQAAKYVFKLENDTWMIRFNAGEIQRGIKNAKALRDIRYLLVHEGEKIDICDLPDNKGIGIQTGSTPVATKGDFKDLVMQIICKHKERDVEEDTLMKKEIEQDLAALEKQKNENFDKHGNPRELSGDLKKVIEATQARVNRWLKEYGDRLPELIAHLTKHPAISSECSYTPDDAIPWDLGKK